MKKVLGCLAILLVALSFNFSIKPVYASESDVKISQLEVNNQSSFASLTGITSFASFDNYVYYTINKELFCYNFLTKNVSKLNYKNVSNLKQTSSHIAFLNNNKLIVLNKDGSTFYLDSPEISANIFGINKQNDITTISYVNNSIMGIIKFNDSGETINSFSNDIGITQIVTMAVSSKYTYIIYEVGNKNNFVKINNDVDFDKTDYTFVYLDCTNLEIMDNSNIVLLTHNGTSALAVLTEEDNSLTLQNDILIKASTTPSFKLGDITDFTDVKVCDNKVLIADSRTNANIQEFSLNNFELVPSKIVLSSTSYELGRFNNVISIQVANNETIYVADSNNRRIQTITNNTATAKTEIGENSFETLKKFETSDNINFYALDKNKIYVYNETNNYLINALNILDITVSENNELYAISSNAIYKANAGAEQLTIVKADNFDKAHLTVTNNFLVVSNNFKLTVYSLNLEQVLYTKTLTDEIKDVKTDYYNNIYALTQNGLTKITYNQNNSTFSSEITQSNFNYDFNSISCFGINKVNGDLICFNNNTQALIKIESNFVNKLTNFENPVDPHNYPTLSTLVPYGKVSNTCYVFDYPYNTNFNYKLLSNSNVYVLDKDTYENYYFVMYNNNNKINFGYVKKDNLSVFNQEENLNVEVEAIYKNVKIYKFPTILKDNNNLGFVSTTINQNVKLTCINKEVVSLDNSKYYAVKLEDGSIGYVNSSDIRDVNTLDIKALPAPNAKFVNGIDTINLYLNDDVNSYVLLELKQDDKFYVENFDPNKDFTKVTFVDDNKVAHIGYLETKYIIMETNNPNLTAAYVLLAVGIVLTIAAVSVYAAYKKGKL